MSSLENTLYYQSGNVAIGKNSSTATLDISGDLIVGKVNVNNISETISKQESGSTTTNLYVDFNKSSIFYVSSQITGNFTCFIANIPSSTSKTYTVNLLLNKSVIGGSNYCATSVRVNNVDYNSFSTYDSAVVPYCSGGYGNISLTNSTITNQSIRIIKPPNAGVNGNIITTNINTMW